METVRGVVNKIVYYNEDNGYGIIKIKLDYKNSEMAKFRSILFSNILTILCSFDRKPIVDEELEFNGEMETSSYGYQLKAKSFRRVSEETKEGIITYLASDFFPSIGRITASKVFESLGDGALKQIVDDKSVLDKVDITQKQKNIIYDNLIIHYKNEHQLLGLLNIGLTMGLSVKLIKALKDDALQIIKKNPYQLIDLIEGIAFLRADDIADHLGIDKKDPMRLQALVLYVLKRSTYSTGNAYIPYKELRTQALQMANESLEIMDKDNFSDAIKFLIETKKIIMDEEENLFDYYIYYDEIKVARRLAEFLKNETKDYSFDKIPQILNEVMGINKIEYSPKQQEAIVKALKEPIVIITGGPGTGKSTIIKGIIDCYSYMFKQSEMVRDKILLVAPTGRASKRLREVTLHNTSTIHKLLGYEGNGRFTITEENPLDAKMIIIDEFSMVDIHLAALLFSCLQPTTKIVIVGDADQLPAVGIGDILLDLINSKEITTIRLDKIHRQASDSSIISLAHSINQGELPFDIMEKQHDRNFISCHEDTMIDFITKVTEQGMESGMDIIKDIQVLVPLYRGIIGIDSINYRMQDAFNKNSQEISYNHRRFRINDKVIQLVNRSEKQVMNGDIGQIILFDMNETTFNGLDVSFDFGIVHYEKDELEDLTLAYAISIHKAQGSEFGLVIMPFSFKYYIMLKRKLIYTAITRAKKFLIMLGNVEAFRKGISELEEKRKTKLQSRLKAIIENPNMIFDMSSAFQEILIDDKYDNLENIGIEDFENSEKNMITEMENITPYDFMKKS